MTGQRPARRAPVGIRVNAVAPTAATRMLTEAMGTQAGDVDPAVLAQIEAVVAALDPALVSPVVAFLAHRDCPVTGEVYTAGGGSVSRFFLARTPGIVNRQLSIEDVRDSLDRIRDEDGYTVPGDSGDENKLILGALHQ